MIRHPFLLALELVATALLALLGHLGLSRPMPPPKSLQFALSAVGEKEQPDGSWNGVDLLRTPWAHVDRFQLTLRPEQRAQLTIDVVDEQGTHRLFPGAGQDGLLAPGRTYALPSPQSFYELDGRAQLRVRVRDVDATASGPAQPLPSEGVTRTFPLSDGSRFDAVERAFRAGAVELEVSR